MTGWCLLPTRGLNWTDIHVPIQSGFKGTVIHIGLPLRYDLIDTDHIAFMFYGGQFPAPSIHQIDHVDTKICMRHLRHNIYTLIKF